ncbi:MAG: hypothetical protein AAF530_24805 [Pseudomonadota bacterium]
MKVLLNSTAAAETGASYAMQDAEATGTNIVQVDFDGGTGTVVIEGRVSESLEWVPFLTVTASDDLLNEIVAVPYIRAVSSGYSQTGDLQVALARS